MPHPTIAPDALEALARRYSALGGGLRVLRNGLSVNSAAALVETRAGVCFAKRYDLAARDMAGIEGEHAIARHLAAKGYPTPALLADAEGHTLVWFDGSPYALYAAAEGEDRYGGAPVFKPLPPAEAASAGARLAELHLAMQDGPTLAPRPVRGLTASFRFMAAGGTLPIPCPPALEPLIHARREALAPIMSALPRGIIHGDFIKRNMFWRGSEVAAVIDFDMWNVEPWVFDLALALIPAAFPWPALLAGEGEVDREALQAFLGGYERIRPLSSAERAALPLVIETARLEFYMSAIAWAPPEVAERFRGLLEGTLRWFDAHPEWRILLTLR